MKDTNVSVIRELRFHDKASEKIVNNLGERGQVINFFDHIKDEGGIKIVGDTLIHEGVVVCLGKIQSETDIFQLFRDIAPRVDVISNDVSFDDLLIAIYKHKGWDIEILDG